MEFNTADICDENGDLVQVVESNMHSFGGVSKCKAEIKTIKLDEDNSGLISMLKEKGDGKIAVVDANGSFCAIVGDTLMEYAKQNNWAGIVVNGYVRDTALTSKIAIGLWALGTCPRKSSKKADFEVDIELDFGGVRFTPGDYLYADCDGIIITRKQVFTI